MFLNPQSNHFKCLRKIKYFDILLTIFPLQASRTTTTTKKDFVIFAHKFQNLRKLNISLVQLHFSEYFPHSCVCTSACACVLGAGGQSVVGQ